jgi:hypothetical protein
MASGWITWKKKTNGRKRAADEAPEDFVDEGQAVTFVGAEREERNGGVWIGGGVAVFVHRRERRELFALALELLDASHGDDGRGPVDHDGIADGLGRGEAPRVRVGPEGGKFPAERHDLGERGGAIRVGDVAFFRGFHHVTATPEIVERVVDGDGADAVLVGQLHGGVHRAISSGLAEFFVGVPDFRGGELGRTLFDFRAGDAALRAGAEEVIEVKRLDAVVRANAVAGRLGAETRALGGFIREETAMLIGRGDEGVVLGFGDDVISFGHGREK